MNKCQTMGVLLIVIGILMTLLGATMLASKKDSVWHREGSILNDPNYISNTQLQADRDTIQKQFGPILDQIEALRHNGKVGLMTPEESGQVSKLRQRLNLLFEQDSLLGVKQKAVLSEINKDYVK